MIEDDEPGMLLGRNTPVLKDYSPQILHAIPRKTARETLVFSEGLPFFGVDRWHAYEMSWLDQTGKPVVRVGVFSVPAHSPNMIESKSFKLYLNSLNSTCFSNIEEARATDAADVSAVAGEAVSLELLTVDAPALTGTHLDGECLDDLNVTPCSNGPGASLLQLQSERIVDEMVYSHLLRSLCPVTGQPDWATLWLHYRGKAIDRSSLLQYIISYRDHREFHEQCVERMFIDLSSACDPEFLHLQAFYTRRGGLDINPFRSTDANARPHPRLARQ